MKRTKSKRSEGTVLIVVLVCLAVATGILLGAVQSSLRQRLQTRQELQMEQTRWLLDAGVSHAITELQRSDEYEGESIKLEAHIGKYKNAELEISVRQEDSEEAIHVRVVAHLGGPHEKSPRMQRSKEFTVNLPTNPDDDTNLEE